MVVVVINKFVNSKQNAKPFAKLIFNKFMYHVMTNKKPFSNYVKYCTGSLVSSYKVLLFKL